jgi:glycosyltransferase involved in cell wall biosynthesis
VTPGARTVPASPISILMPVFNEIDVIRDVVAEWQEEVLRFLPPGSEMLFDDCSTDGTRETLEEMGSRQPFIRVMSSPRDGFFNAAMRLYRGARNPVVFFTDSDGQYVPSEFWRLTPHLDEHDIVHGAKIDRQDPWYRITASHVFNRIATRMFGVRSDDINSAFRLVKRAVLDALLDRLGHLTMLPNAEMLIRAEMAGFRVKSILVRHRARQYGASRGLPPSSFLAECVNAYRGLRTLRDELTGTGSAGRPAERSTRQ